MKVAKSRLTGQGQISVPAEVRRRLGLAAGSVLEWEIEGDLVLVRRAGRHSSEELHQVLFPVKPRKRSLPELEEGIRSHMRKRHARR
ncbi:MAG: AbrB/MazE/SpoVT family DNA-binding domain-containing protein [Planctomycetota bacterium]|nr:MAG: AbrB/MazE/SpoVT family DNA-binding domain-containing protein [Planctomycetota bacterium]